MKKRFLWRTQTSYKNTNKMQEEYRMRRMQNRLLFIMCCFISIYGLIAARLCYFGAKGGEIEEAKGPAYEASAARPDILDRNGRLLATDIKTYSLFATPKRIIDADETIELLSTIIPKLDWQTTYNRLKSKSSFAWIRRNLTPEQKMKIMALGIPGIGFRTEIQRLYPNGPAASHILGTVDIDNIGTGGIEKYIDNTGLSDLRAAGLADKNTLKSVKLSIDIRIQTVVREELIKAFTRYQAVGAGAIVLNIHTGEVLAMASIPDFDPNHPVDVLKTDRLNRMSAGTYEMGSTIKIFTTAMALDSGLFHLNTLIDASKPLPAGRGRFIHDFHGKYRPMPVWEVFTRSSNIGSAQEALALGIERHQEFLRRLGLLDRLQTELPETARPFSPMRWSDVTSMTIAFGHGMRTTPLQTAVGSAALVNGGVLIPPTFIQRDKPQALMRATRVISEKTSQEMRYLFKLNADIGSGRRGRVIGYRVGGKTGTAEKVIDGRYAKDRRFNSYIAAFPIDAPQYIVLTIIDDPHRVDGEPSATAAYNATPVAANIIRRSATFLGIKPDFIKENAPILAAQTNQNLPETRPIPPQ